MKKNLWIFIAAVLISACDGEVLLGRSSSGGSSTLASNICSGVVINGVTGTANCVSNNESSLTAGNFTVFSARSDNESLTVDVGNFLDLDFLNGREVATIQDAHEGNEVYTDNYSVIPRPLDESDGRYRPCLYTAGWVCDYSDVPSYQEKRHYLETIVGAKTGNPRSSIQICGQSGTIESRISDCKTKNGNWAFYDGDQYGQIGEGDWSLVVVVENAGTKYEVWRDERTQMLWSDKSQNQYNWYQATGYSKATADSVKETQFTSEPGVLENSVPFSLNETLQPAAPISVCPDIVAGEIAAGGGTYSIYDNNPELLFKGNLTISDDVIWKMPSNDDWRLADINGIRKVLPNIEFEFWSSTTFSEGRYGVFTFEGDDGYAGYSDRNDPLDVRCIAFVRQ